MRNNAPRFVPGRVLGRHLALLALAAVLATAALGLLSGGCRDAAPPGRTVVLYCSADQVIAEPIIAEFERTHGINVAARYDTEAAKTVGLVQRLRTEADHPAADVFWSSEVFHTVRLTREGLFEAAPDLVPDGWPAKFVDPQSRWIGFGLRARVLAYHTARVKADEAPTRVEDLLDPRWRGRIVMANPEFGTTTGHVASWFVVYGPERATEILEGLKANEVRLVDGNSTAVRMVATGQADLALTDTDDVYAGIRNEWPVAMKLLGHGAVGPLAIPNTVAVVRGAPHPAEAHELAAYLLSEAVESALARSDSRNTPVRPGLVDEFPDLRIDGAMAVDYEAVADAMPEAIRTANRILK